MRSDPRALRERIRLAEASSHRDTPLRRAYNRKLRAHRTPRGGGGLPNEEEFNALNDKVSTLEKQVESLKDTKVSVRYIKDHLEKRVSKLETSVAEHEKIWGMLHKLNTKFSTLDEKVSTLDI